MKSTFARNWLFVLPLLVLGCAEAYLTPPGPPADAETIVVGNGTVALWQRSTAAGVEHFYAISPDGENYKEPRQTNYQLHLEFGSVTTERFASEAVSSNEEDLYLVQFVTQPLQEYRVALQTAGAEIYQYMPEHSYVVKMSTTAHAQVRQLPFVRWVGTYKPEYRQSPEAFLLAGETETRLNIITPDHSRMDRGAFVAKLQSIGGQVHSWSPENILVDVSIPTDKRSLIATWNEVIFVERWSAPEQDMDIVRSIGGAVEMASVHGFDGAGVRGEVMDGNVLDSHSDFAATPLLIHGTTRSGSQSHGTSTSGIVFGDGSGDTTAVGMLPAAQGIFASYKNLGDRYTHTEELLQPEYEAVFQSNSWGDGRTTRYSAISAEMDMILFELDLPVFQSQSNSGSQQSRPQAWSKNIISVGGVRHRGTEDRSDDSWGGGASIGPAADGRIKPDLCHFYDVVNTASSSGGYTQFSGTSAATPIVAGHAGVFLQMWAEGIFGNSVSGVSVFADRPHMTTTKAFLINTALSYEFSGLSDDLTRTHQGWGLPDLQHIYDVRESVLLVNETDILNPTQTRTYSIDVEDGASTLRATMVFADPAGNPASAQARVNDLSLRLVSPSGLEYLGNVGLLMGNVSQTGGEVDRINSVENVFLVQPEPGTWRVEVSADEVNQDGHTETAELDADFALVVTGGTAAATIPPSAGTPVMSRVAYDTPGTDSIEEFVELYNPTTGPISLNGWALRDNSKTWVLPPATTIAAGENLMIARNADGFRAWQGVDADVAGMTLALGNRGDSVALLNDVGEQVDFVAWENAEPEWTLVAGRGELLERIDVNVESSPLNWQTRSSAP